MTNTELKIPHEALKDHQIRAATRATLTYVNSKEADPATMKYGKKGLASLCYSGCRVYRNQPNENI